MEFDPDYIAPPEVIDAVVAEMSGGGLKPLSDEEKEIRRLEHEAFLFECRQRDEQQRLEREPQRAEAEAEAERQARQQATVARAERNARLREQQRLDSASKLRDAQLASLHRASLEQQQFRHAVVKSQTFANQRQRLKSVLFPPEPPQPLAEPEIDPDPVGSYFGEPGFSVELWSKRKRNRSWW
jgi:hypothetical protein